VVTFEARRGPRAKKFWKHLSVNLHVYTQVFLDFGCHLSVYFRTVIGLSRDNIGV
jgi:hypothetical protein